MKDGGNIVIGIGFFLTFLSWSGSLGEPGLGAVIVIIAIGIGLALLANDSKRWGIVGLIFGIVFSPISSIGFGLLVADKIRKDRLLEAEENSEEDES